MVYNMMLWYMYAGVGKVGLQLWVCDTEFILVLLFINYCIIFHMNNCKPTFAHPCVCKMITAIKLINDPAPYRVIPFCVMRTFKIYFLSKFQVYNIALLVTVTMQNISSPELTHPAQLRLCTLWQTSLLLHAPGPRSHHSMLCFCESGCFRFHL